MGTGKEKEIDSPLDPPMECSPASTLNFAQEDQFQVQHPEW